MKPPIWTIHGPGPAEWLRVGRYDGVRRRALWMWINHRGAVPSEALEPVEGCPGFLRDLREGPHDCAVILRSGREGDDAYVELRASDFVDHQKWLDFEDCMTRAAASAEDREDAERYAAARRELESEALEGSG